MVLNQVTKLLHSKGENSQSKKQPTKWKKILSPDWVLIFRTYKELKNQIAKEQIL